MIDFLGELRFHLLQLLRNGYFLQLALLPSAVFVALRLISGSGDASLLWSDGISAGIWTTSVSAVGIIGYQRAQGTLEYMAASPRPLGWTLTPLAVSCSLLGLLAIPVTAIVVGISLGNLAVLSPLLFAAGTVLIAVACALSALCLSGLFVITRHAIVYEPVLVAPVLLLSGTVIPFSAMGQPWQTLALLHPLTGAVAIMHEAAGSSEGPLWMWLIQFVLACLLLTVAAWSVLRVAVRRSRLEGTLQLS